MDTGHGENEGFWLNKEFVGQAILEPDLFPPGTAFGRGENEGMTLLDEVVVDLNEEPPEPTVS